MEVRVKLVAFPMSFNVISLKLLVLYSSSQALMISSLRASVSSGDPFGMGLFLAFFLFEGETLSKYLAGFQILIGGELKKHRFQGLIIDLALFIQMFLRYIGVVDVADEALKTRGIVDIPGAALYCQRRFADDRRSSIPKVIFKNSGFICFRTTDRAYIVRLRQHSLVHKVNRELFCFLNAPVDKVRRGETDQYTVMTDDANMGD